MTGVPEKTMTSRCDHSRKRGASSYEGSRSGPTRDRRLGNAASVGSRVREKFCLRVQEPLSESERDERGWPRGKR